MEQGSNKKREEQNKIRKMEGKRDKKSLKANDCSILGVEGTWRKQGVLVKYICIQGKEMKSF